MTSAELYAMHLAEALPGTPLRAAMGRVPQGTASAADLIAYARWELDECMWSLPPDPHDEPRARPVDGFHAGCCAMRAGGALRQLARLLAVKP